MQFLGKISYSIVFSSPEIYKACIKHETVDLGKVFFEIAEYTHDFMLEAGAWIRCRDWILSYIGTIRTSDCFITVV